MLRAKPLSIEVCTDYICAYACRISLSSNGFIFPFIFVYGWLKLELGSENRGFLRTLLVPVDKILFLPFSPNNAS